MKRDEIKAHRVAKIVADVQPTPINPGFISITELLARWQTAPAEPPMTMTDAAEWLLFNWCNAKNPPAWTCNGKLGIVPIDAFTEKHEIPLKRLDYVFHNGHFESDGGNGASSDYELYGFDRKEFSDFMVLLGESMDLFCPVPEPQADTAPEQNTATPAPVVADSASDAPATQDNIMKRAALIAELEYEWSSIVADISDATRNGLKTAAHTGKHGEWDKDKARAWAVSKGKIKRDAPVHSLAAVWSGAVTRNTIGDR